MYLQKTSVGDPDPQDQHVFWPPGYGSGYYSPAPDPSLFSEMC